MRQGRNLPQQNPACCAEDESLSGTLFRQIGAKSDSTPYLSHVDARLVCACLQENITMFDVVRWGLLAFMQSTVSILSIASRISFPVDFSVSFSGSQNGAPLRLAPVLCDILITMAITICSAWLKLLGRSCSRVGRLAWVAMWCP